MSDTIEQDMIPFFIGSYCAAADNGIYVYRLDISTGALEPVSAVGGLENPSFLALHPTKPLLYAVIETAAGEVAALSYDEQSFELKVINSASTGGSPCHLVVDASGQYVLAANYGGGSVCMMPLRDDGGVEEASDFVQHVGSSVHARQSEPHAHSINIDPGNRFAFAPDLGLDKIMMYELDLDLGKLRPHTTQPYAETPGGSGPRHLAFLPNRRLAYVINEIDNTITAFNFDESTGTLQTVETVSTLPDDFSATSGTADIHVEPSGRFLYGSNRGHDSIAIYAIDPVSGRLQTRGHVATGGAAPRNFAIDPSGNFLLVANQSTDDIRTFRIHPEDGSLAATGHVAEVQAPVCMQFLRTSTRR